MRDPVDQLLEDAAAAGRTSPPPEDELARYGHAPVPPTLRCQDCGRWIRPIGDFDDIDAPYTARWAHAADEL
jgi:hypothetical protein